jgi:hypothetical protein
MAHFAKLDETNTVVEVLVVNNNDIGNLPFPESEPVGQDFLTKIFPGERFVQTSYNSNFRKRYAGIEYTYFVEHDGFAPPKAYPYFIFDVTECAWVPPIPYPTGGGKYAEKYTWVHEAYAWVVVNVPFTSIGE